MSKGKGLLKNLHGILASFRWAAMIAQGPNYDKKGQGQAVHYPRPIRSTRPHLGKKMVRATKRKKVFQMKAAGHFKGDNTPWAV